MPSGFPSSPTPQHKDTIESKASSESGRWYAAVNTLATAQNLAKKWSQFLPPCAHLRDNPTSAQVLCIQHTAFHTWFQDEDFQGSSFFWKSPALCCHVPILLLRASRKFFIIPIGSVTCCMLADSLETQKKLHKGWSFGLLWSLPFQREDAFRYSPNWYDFTYLWFYQPHPP